MLRKTREDEASTGGGSGRLGETEGMQGISRTPTKPAESAGWDKMLNILIGGLSLLVVALVISLIVRLNTGSSDTIQTTEIGETAASQGDETVQVKSKVIRVEVLNGTGVPKLASRAADFLRSKGFDVVQTGNAQHANFKTSVVQDRLGNIQNAIQVARELGIGEGAVIQQKNPQLYLEVTVIIGQDYKSLKFFAAGN